MKKTYWWIIALVLLGFVIAGLFFSMAPDQIPVHYGVQGQVDRWGSKYEFILLPVINLLFGAFMVWLARREGKQGREMNEQVVSGMTVWILVLFNLIWLFFMWKAINIENIGNGLGDLSLKALMILLFASFIPLGNKLPKSQRNSFYGLRTKWSMANDRCWQKSQRLGGYVFVISGILGVLLCALLPAKWGCIIMVASLAITIVACVVGSYRIYRQEQNA